MSFRSRFIAAFLAAFGALVAITGAIPPASPNFLVMAMAWVSAMSFGYMFATKGA